MCSRMKTTTGVLGCLAAAFILSWMIRRPAGAAGLWGSDDHTDEVVFLGTEGVILQNRRNDCGLAALAMVLRHNGIEASMEEIEDRAGLSHRGASMLRLKDIAAQFNLCASGWRIEYDDLNHVKLPAILFVGDRHFVVVDSVDERMAACIRDPAVGRLRIPRRILEQKWKGEVLLLARTN